jgi:transcriptional regulator with XRE-family HTH domain
VLVTTLRARREQRGWTKTQLDVRLRSAAKRRGEVLPQPESLARQIARWENGHGAVSELYQQLFCEVYACSPTELGFIQTTAAPASEPEPEPSEEFTIELARAASVDVGVAKLLQGQTDGIRQLDALQGAQLLTGVRDVHDGVIGGGVGRHAKASPGGCGARPSGTRCR